MEFTQLTNPIAKRQSSDVTLKAFPIDRIPEANDDRPFVGIYTGLSVEIIDSNAIKSIYCGGNFGLSTKTKTSPQFLNEGSRVRNINQAQYDRKLAWNAKFSNQNSNDVTVNLSEKNRIGMGKKRNRTNCDHEPNQSEEKAATQCEQIAENMAEPMETENETPEPALNLVVDPFPIEETLALLPEEALFLHHSLRCLRVMDFEQSHELTTHEMLEQFCRNDPKFIQNFVVYHYYRSKNWVVKSGLKFGGEFCKCYQFFFLFNSNSNL